MRRKIWPIASLLPLATFAITLSLLMLGCGQSFSSNGQRIYFTAESTSGQPITYSGGPGPMMQNRLACVNCHGPQGKGGTVNMMMQRFDVPNITWTELTSPGSDHPPFTEETVKRAITQGIDESGAALKYPMPRWQMSESDLNDLIGFIKTLK
jgi:cytochrome c oxidase subunit II